MKKLLTLFFLIFLIPLNLNAKILTIQLGYDTNDKEFTLERMLEYLSYKYTSPAGSDYMSKSNKIAIFEYNSVEECLNFSKQNSKNKWSWKRYPLKENCKFYIYTNKYPVLYKYIKKIERNRRNYPCKSDDRKDCDRMSVASYKLIKNKMERLGYTIEIFSKDLISEKIEIAKKESKTTNEDLAKLEEEKKKIAEEKKKIEAEKKRIADAKKKQEEEERKKKEEQAKLYIIGSGTGFFVSAEGHIVSNDHVVGICRKVASKIGGELKYFNVLKTDEVNDLGLIKGDYKSPSYLSIKSDGAEFGEDVIAFGYPLEDELSTSVKLTRGIVSSLSGPGNNYSEIQIDAAIQPGNSGGPVMNMDGQVVGVASSGLNKLYMLEKSEYIPENVNFAVASSTLSNFLKANGVSITNQKFNIKNTKELAKIGRPSTLQLFCMNTKAVFEELKKKKKHSDVLFEKVMDIK